MKQEYINNLPKWYNDDNGKYNLILSNDIDSLVGCTVLEQVKNWKANCFYSFKDVYRFNDNLQGEKLVGVDISIMRGRCFDNHVNRLSSNDTYNELTINPNIINGVTRDNYFNKYCGSTALLIWSIYGLPLPKTEEGKMLLMAIDTTYKGFYSTKYPIFGKMNKFYLCDMFEFEELYELQSRHTEKDFRNIISKYHLYDDISIRDNKLHSNLKLEEISKLLELPIELPKSELKHKMSFVAKSKDLQSQRVKEDISNNIFSLALTGRNHIEYTTFK